jgi:hypothetical protein
MLQRSARFYSLSSLWFLAIGPAFVLPIPWLLPWSYIAGCVPAVLTGLLFALTYKSHSVPAHRLRRAWSGAQVGSTVSLAFATLIYLAMNRGLPHLEQAAMQRLEFESALLAVFAFAACGAAGGGLAAALLPRSIWSESAGSDA